MPTTVTLAPSATAPLEPAQREGAPRLALRERNKLDKRERIRAASAELFTRQGYASATLRDIAQQAGVGLGTLFNLSLIHI